MVCRICEMRICVRLFKVQPEIKLLKDFCRLSLSLKMKITNIQILDGNNLTAFASSQYKYRSIRRQIMVFVDEILIEGKLYSSYSENGDRKITAVCLGILSYHSGG